jgi:CheY-like chemotaxis protein
MMMEAITEFLTAVAAVAWPILVATVLYLLFPSIKALVGRDKVTIKVAGMEVSAEQAANSFSGQIKDLQDKVAELQQRLLMSPDELALKDLGLTKPIRRGEKLRVLWVDDVPANNAIQIEKLTSDGYWVDVATETSQAMEMFENTKFDLIISDMGRVERGANIPNAGVILAREIKRRDSSVPFVIFSTKAAIQRYGQEAHEAGAKYVTNSTIDLYQIISLELGQPKKPT